MTTRRTLTNLIFAESLYLGLKFPGPRPYRIGQLVTRSWSYRQELLQKGDLAQLAMRQDAALEKVEHTLDTFLRHDVPGNRGVARIGHAVDG